MSEGRRKHQQVINEQIDELRQENKVYSQLNAQCDESSYELENLNEEIAVCILAALPGIT